MAAPELDRRQIDLLRDRLVVHRRKLEAQLSSTDEAARPVNLDQQAVGRVSRIDAIQHQQMAIANRQQATRLLQRIDLSLKRIDSGEYGYCLQCAEPIAFARLQAQPFAGLCLECQSANENSRR